MKVPIEALREATRRAIAAQGFSKVDTEIILDVILYAQLRGNNQNVIKLLGAGMPADPKAGEITLVKDTKLSALIDGAWNQGMVVVSRATALASEKANAHGFGIVGTRRSNSPTGAIGFFARALADAGLIGFVCSGSMELMAMHGSYEPFLGTNPLAIGIPTAGKPIVFDMATASIAWYGIHLAQAEGKRIPAGVAYDSDGRLTTDPAAALAGAIKAFGGYKGAALALIVEVLTRPLVGASRDEAGKKLDWGNLVFAIDPELLADDLASFQADVSALLARVKGLKRLPGVDEILAPGERGDRVYERVMAAGEIEMDERIWRDLQAVGASVDNPD
ncbi:MAG: Ldh family oxidoreductase [Chloroflexota bacterium]|nr:Ldh family oxidoreductase [Chloroflexota bacterium]MDE2909082.1 Ldh family oxidoreductase [Chloroflexota bacterium]